jgi:hypothetical protein
MSSVRETMQLRRSRALTVRAGGSMSEYETDRRCSAPDCRTVLSRYNPASSCAAHAGWQDPPGKRQRG